MLGFLTTMLAGGAMTSVISTSNEKELVARSDGVGYQHLESRCSCFIVPIHQHLADGLPRGDGSKIRINTPLVFQGEVGVRDGVQLIRTSVTWAPVPLNGVNLRKWVHGNLDGIRS